MVDSMSEDTPVPRVRNIESISSKKTMTGQPSSLFSPGTLEDQTDLAFGFTDVFVEEFRSFDVDEVAAALTFTNLVCDLAGQTVGHRFGDQSLTATWRAIEQDAFGRREAMLCEKILVEKRQFHRISDLFNLVVKSPDIAIGDVGDLFEE
jgi:hypothetical protein